MEISILYFASLRDYVGKANECLQFEAKTDSLTAKAVWDVATSQRSLPKNTLIAINQNYVDVDALLQDGDELAFFPPVTGG
jgi:molybdopterin synthase sulfur carrier subunit